MGLSKTEVTQELNLLISKGKAILETKWSPMDSGIISFHTYVNYESYVSWRTDVIGLIRMFLPSDNTHRVEFEKLEEHEYSNLKACIKILEGLTIQIERGYVPVESSKISASSELQRIFDNFHRIARQLRSRYGRRQSINIDDEYDVQDLLHALLLLYFDDIRKEEWVPSYAGGASRTDFLLKKERIVIEVKKTRQSMTDNDLGEQLIVDIEKYKKHPDCGQIYCFVYDPEGRLGNPHGIMSDLNTQHNGFVNVIIRPE